MPSLVVEIVVSFSVVEDDREPQGNQASCMCLGDPHCTSYDKNHFDFQTVCKLMLSAHEPDFQVWIVTENRDGDTEVSYPKDIIIVIGSETIELQGDYTSIFSQPVKVVVRKSRDSVRNVIGLYYVCRSTNDNDKSWDLLKICLERRKYNLCNRFNDGE